MALDPTPTWIETSAAAPLTAPALPDPDAMLTRRAAAAALTAAGYPTAPATLARKASVGGGPVFRRYGSRVIYRWRDLLAWAEGRLSPLMRSTGEANRERAAP